MLYRSLGAADVALPPRDLASAAAARDLRAVVVGATGATGRQLVRQLCEDERWTAVTAVVRRTPSPGELYEGATPPPKLRLQVVEAFDSPEQEAEMVREWQGAHVLFNALGTTRGAAGSAAEFKRVEVDHGGSKPQAFRSGVR